jgi:hypothetical protein
MCRDIVDAVKRAGARMSLDWTGPGLLLENDDRIPEALMARIREERDCLRGYLLLCELWDAGYSVELHPSVRGGLFILPVGGAGASEKLIKRYEIHHEAALRVMLEVLPRDANGEPDWRLWNKTSRTFRVFKG